MNFFPLDPALKDALSDFSNPILIALTLTLSDQQTLTIPHENLKTAQITSFSNQDGIILTTGELTFTLPEGSAPQIVIKAEIHLSSGAYSLTLHRFTMIPDEKNLQHLQEGGQDDLYRLFLEDSLARIKRTRNLRDWTSTETLVDSAACDKEHPEKSLFHAMALKAGVPPGEIDCVSIPLTVPYAKPTRSPYAELCDLTRAMHARLSSGTDKTLILSDSRYQQEESDETEIPTLEEKLFYHLATHTADDRLQNLFIEGAPTVVLSNQACYRRDQESIDQNGLKILNHTGKHFLDHEVNGIPHFEDWTTHTLATNKEPRRRFSGETQHGLFYPRVGSKTYLSLETGETPLTRVTELKLTYSVKEGFTAQITLEEEKGF